MLRQPNLLSSTSASLPQTEQHLITLSKKGISTLYAVTEAYKEHPDRTPKEKLNELGNIFGELGIASVQLAQIKQLSGSNNKACQRIMRTGNALMSFGKGIEAISTAKSLLSLSSLNGGLSLVLGMASLMGDEGNDRLGEAMQAIMEALNEIYQAIEKGFQELKQIMAENMAVLIHRLEYISNQLDRIENIMSVSFKELHYKDLIENIMILQKCLNGEHSMPEQAKKDLIVKLSIWMENYSKSPIQTSLIRETEVAKKAVELFDPRAFNATSMLPLLMTQLTKLLPSYLFEQTAIKEIPNIELLKIASKFYIMAIVNFRFEDNYLASIQRTLALLARVKNTVNTISSNENIYDALFRQYDYWRYQVGRAIAKCRPTFPNNAAADTPLIHLLGNNMACENVRNNLDELELRRLLLIHLCSLTQVRPELNNKIQQLESKQTLLQRTKKEYEAKQDLIHPSCHIKLAELKIGIRHGADINQWDFWGQPIHYLARLGRDNTPARILPDAALAIHELFKSAKELEYGNGTRYDRQDTWGMGISPIKYALNNGHFELAVLYMASGYDIGLEFGYFYNGLLASKENGWQYIIQRYLVTDMLNENGILNKKELRKAYAFYQAAEAGLPVSDENINQQCLLWLVAILGDLKPLQVLRRFSANVNQPIPICNATPLMMAVYCGQEKVVDFLLEHNARLDVAFAVTDPGPEVAHPTYKAYRNFVLHESEKPHLLFLAIIQKHFTLAKKLVDAGLRPTAAQQQKINDGLRMIVPATAPAAPHQMPSQSNEHQALINLDETVQLLNDAVPLLQQLQTNRVNLSQTSSANTASETSDTYEHCRFFQHCIAQVVNQSPTDQLRSNLEKLIASIDELSTQIVASNPSLLTPVLNKVINQFNLIDAALKIKLGTAYTLGTNISDLKDELKRLRH